MSEKNIGSKNKDSEINISDSFNKVTNSPATQIGVENNPTPITAEDDCKKKPL